MKAAVFISGGGTNMMSLVEAVKSGEIKNTEISLVFSNRSDAPGLEKAKNEGVSVLYMNPKDYSSNEEYDKALAEKMNDAGAEVICLAGYMKILTPVFLDTFKGRIMNVHPALLPSFGGKGFYGLNVHKAVLDYGADTGPVILQEPVKVEDNDTPESLQKRVLEKEHELYKKALGLYAEGKLEIKGRRVFIK
ncbi:MAG TPA: phosphoribosylglycinamide formyltransferase [Firmicutes bacterium]|nr:phosphoribosylglycinamide formyltransferase [Bacillota bacterium]